MEKRLDGLITLLADKEATEARATWPKSPYSVPSLSTVEKTSLNFADSLLPPPLLSDFGRPSPLSPFFGFPFPMMDGINDIISKGVVNLDHVERCVRYFRAETCDFPFVIVPEESSVDFLRRGRPVLLLAILCMATRSDARLQRQLEREIRDTLSRKVMFNCEKSLDLIQAILVYVTW